MKRSAIKSHPRAHEETCADEGGLAADVIKAVLRSKRLPEVWKVTGQSPL